jgi:hypothetical protein
MALKLYSIESFWMGSAGAPPALFGAFAEKLLTSTGVERFAMAGSASGD